MRELRSQFWTPRPLDAVFPFFADAANLDALTPPWLHFQILTPMPLTMQVGARIDYRLRLRGLPMRWQSEITAWEPPHRFVDEQRRGPYKTWWHEHTFVASQGGTLVVDHVRYQSRGWILEPLLQRLLVGPDLARVFTFRDDKLREHFGGRVPAPA